MHYFSPPPLLSRWGLRLSPLVASVGPYIIDLQTRIGWRNFCVYFTTAPTVHEIWQIYPRQEFNYWLSPNKVLRAPFLLEMMYSEADWLYWSPVGSGLSPSLSGLETNTKWQLGTIFSPIMRFSRKPVITITAILALQRGLPATSAFIKIFSVGTQVLSGSFGYRVVLTIDFVLNFLTAFKPYMIQFHLHPPPSKKKEKLYDDLIRPVLDNRKWRLSLIIFLRNFSAPVDFSVHDWICK